MVAILLHLYYQDLWDEFKQKILPLLDSKIHLYISVNSESEFTDDMRTYAKKVFIVKNKGMDFGPFVYVWDKIKDDNYDYVVKLHGKKSSSASKIIGEQFGIVWRQTLVNSLIKDKESFDTILSFMRENSDVFMAGSKKYFYDDIKESKDHLSRIAALKSIEKLLKKVNAHDYGFFVAGSIFLVTTKYLKLFFGDCNLKELYEEFEDYYSDNGELLAHGFERVIGYGVSKHNGKFLVLEAE